MKPLKTAAGHTLEFELRHTTGGPPIARAWIGDAKPPIEAYGKTLREAMDAALAKLEAQQRKRKR